MLEYVISSDRQVCSRYHNSLNPVTFYGASPGNVISCHQRPFPHITYCQKRGLLCEVSYSSRFGFITRYYCFFGAVFQQMALVWGCKTKPPIVTETRMARPRQPNLSLKPSRADSAVIAVIAAVIERRFSEEATICRQRARWRQADVSVRFRRAQVLTAWCCA